jgi:hypothetical protein
MYSIFLKSSKFGGLFEEFTEWVISWYGMRSVRLTLPRGWVDENEVRVGDYYVFERWYGVVNIDGKVGVRVIFIYDERGGFLFNDVYKI